MPLISLVLVHFAFQAADAFTLSTGELTLSPSFKLNAYTGHFPTLQVMDINVRSFIPPGGAQI